MVGAVPFEPIQPGSKNQKGAAKTVGSSQKKAFGWWSGQNRLTQGLLLAVLLLVPGLVASLVLLYSHIAEHHPAEKGPLSEVVQANPVGKEKAPVSTGKEDPKNIPVIPSEAAFLPPETNSPN